LSSRFSIAWRSIVALARATTGGGGASTRMVTPLAVATVRRGAHRRDHVGAAAGRLGGAALPEHLPGQRVELVDLADQQVHHAGGVHALGAEHADRLSHHAQRGHPPAELMGEHGEVVRRVVRCARRPAGGGH
jgi:hypothetical protein